MDEQLHAKGVGRYLSSLDVWGMAFGCMAGWGAFVMPGAAFLPAAGPAGTILVMLIGMTVILAVGFSASCLMARNPRTGGVSSYTKEAFGRDHAFLCSRFLCLSYLTIVFLNGTALFLVIRTLTDSAVQGPALVRFSITSSINTTSGRIPSRTRWPDGVRTGYPGRCGILPARRTYCCWSLRRACFCWRGHWNRINR